MDPLIHEQPGAAIVTLTALALMVVGAVLTIRTGRWYGRVLLVLGALAWPIPDQPLQGPILIERGGHGVHVADLLSLVAVIVAAVPWVRIRTRGRSG